MYDYHILLYPIILHYTIVYYVIIITTLHPMIEDVTLQYSLLSYYCHYTASYDRGYYITF